MNEKLLIRLARREDLREINAIYNHYVTRSTCTYQEHETDGTERAQWFEEHGEKQPVTVAEVEGRVAGWASLSLFRTRTAYRFTLENAVYVRHDLQGRGIGSALLGDSIERGKQSGHHSIIAVIDA